MAPFYVFPCGHAFHANCLIGHVTRCSNQVQVSLSTILQLIVVIFSSKAGLCLISYTNHLWMSLLCCRLREYWTFRNGLAWWTGKQQKKMGQVLLVNLLRAQPQLTRSANIWILIPFTLQLLCWCSQSLFLQLRSQLDDAVASECPFCGDLMIKEISQPFILPQESDERESWEIKPQPTPQKILPMTMSIWCFGQYSLRWNWFWLLTFLVLIFFCCGIWYFIPFCCWVLFFIYLPNLLISLTPRTLRSRASSRCLCTETSVASFVSFV